jgi:hypothetical protein
MAVTNTAYATFGSAGQNAPAAFTLSDDFSGDTLNESNWTTFTEGSGASDVPVVFSYGATAEGVRELAVAAIQNYADDLTLAVEFVAG